jgi:antitoxin component YwqK of YwqJK toxin-antitoxin module
MRSKILAMLFGSVLLLSWAEAQNDTINQVDGQGMKQGYWQKEFPNGKIMYTGYFKNGKPVGEMRRFYETGELKVMQTFRENSDKVYTKFFYDDGELAGEGNYVKNQKDSLWTYYSYYSGAITSTEMYVNGIKHGIEKKYYPNGQVSEEIEWQQNMKNGVWNQYFDDGTIKLKANYVFNSLNGPYSFFWPNGKIYILGNFVDNKRHGTWTFYSDDGTKKSEIVYNYGKADNEEEIIAKDQEFFKMVEENIGKFQDPTIEDVMPGSGIY